MYVKTCVAYYVCLSRNANKINVETQSLNANSIIRYVSKNKPTDLCEISFSFIRDVIKADQVDEVTDEI